MSGFTISTVILAAGFGTRMRSSQAKVLHEIGGRAMLGHVIDAATDLNPVSLSIVIGDHAPEAGEYARSIRDNTNVFVQSPPRGTGDAVKQALPALENTDGAVLVLFADTPLLRTDTLKSLADTIKNGAMVAVLGFTPPVPGQYGRLKTDADGNLEAIVEAADATDAERAISLCNSGVMAFDAKFLRERINNIGNDNAKGEYYLTDMVAIARQSNRRCVIVRGDSDEVLGVNSRIELAAAEKIFQRRMRDAAMIDGATLLDPDTIYFSYDTKIGRDVVVGQNVVFGLGVEIGDNVVIKPYTHIEGATIAANVSVGPFARLRPGADIRDGAHVGNFVEVKNAQIGEGAKVGHLSYIGDADVGSAANIGAGTITCNYDGYNKHRTVIGERAFIGSNAALVAPVRIGDDAYVGSGSVITKDIQPGDLAVGRGRQAVIKGWAARFRAAHAKKNAE